MLHFINKNAIIKVPTSRGYLDDLSHLDIGSTNLIDYPRLWQTRMLMRDMYSQGWADLFF